MNVHIVVASKHGSTREIAARLASFLRDRGHAVDLQTDPATARLDGADAVVLGSAVYAGRWLREAREFAERELEALRRRPTWLFSSGPLGSPPLPPEETADIGPLLRRTDARGHRLFAGRMERVTLGPGERALVWMLRAPEGDFRPWDAIEDWAREIAKELDAVERAACPPPGERPIFARAAAGAA